MSMEPSRPSGTEATEKYGIELAVFLCDLFENLRALCVKPLFLS
jgi:hypothetical protein